MDRNAIVRLAMDLNKGVKTFSFEENTYSANEAVEVLRQALVDANGGSSKFDYKSLRRNKVEIFEIIEELVPQIINEGLTGNEFWNSHVDYKNIALGDKNEFFIEDAADFVVSTIADGIATPRRQRLGGGTRLTVDTSVHAIRIYDEFSRFMAGRIDWNTLCNKVAESFQKAIWADIYTAFGGVVANIQTGTPYKKTGTVVETDLMDMIAHVEASTGKTAKIIGTQKALNRITTVALANNTSDLAKNDLYNQGYYGKFYGTDIFKLDQAHVPGDKNTFILTDDIYVIASDDKFIKFVDEGETIIDDRDWTQNADMTIEYRMLQRWGIGVIVASDGGVAVYEA